MSLEQDIREYALDIGFDRVGFTTAEPFDLLTRELDERRDMYSWVSENLLQLRSVTDPKNIMPSGKSLIVLLWDYHKKAFPEEFLGKIGGEKSRTVLDACLKKENSPLVIEDIKKALT